VLDSDIEVRPVVWQFRQSPALCGTCNDDAGPYESNGAVCWPVFRLLDGFSVSVCNTGIPRLVEDHEMEELIPHYVGFVKAVGVVYY